MANSTDPTLRGVNLGGWLLLERWITPSLFADLPANDEYTLSGITSTVVHERLLHHRDTFVTEADFKWLKQHNIDIVRIPIGYWALTNEPPYSSCQYYLDQAFAWANRHGIRILLDLHGAPGSQNGRDHSGRIGRIGRIHWSKQANIEHTMTVIERLCDHYGDDPALWGIELLNEPGWQVRRRTLLSFYDQAYDIVRSHSRSDIQVSINDVYRPESWVRFLANPRYENLGYDLHLYQCFSPWDKRMKIDAHVEKARELWLDQIKGCSRPVIVGEWSCALDPRTFKGMDDPARIAALTAFANAQLDTFANAQAWFFWTYKTEDMPGWSFRNCINTGIITI